jgi:hypothetical protein
MTDPIDRITSALAERYRIERELGAGGMGPQMNADVGGSTRIDARITL